MVVATQSTPRAQTVDRLRLPRAGGGGTGSLPGELNAFVGRDRELARLHELTSQTRLLTLVGPGGVGKTRLALRLGTALSDAPVDGARLIDLSSVTASLLVPQAFGDVLGIQEPSDSWIGELTRLLRPRKVLLVVDNCEHLTDACADLIGGLLQACPGASVLATSRQPLGVAGETTWRVPPLAVPPTSAQRLEELADSEAVRLFVVRVRAHLPDFTLNVESARAVAAICRQLDGLPLALELVAARVESLGLAEVFTRLTRGLDVVSGSTRQAPSRQQTLRAALDWSWSLLDEREQVLLRRLTTFAGGWTLEAATQVCSGDDALPEPAVVDTLSNLVSKSLVLADHADAGVRYRLLQTVRTYAHERLHAAGELTILQQRHATFMMSLAERTPVEAVDSVQAALLIPEEDNVRTALDWAVRQEDVQAGLRLAMGAYPMWMFAGHYSEGVGWFERLLNLPESSSAPAARALALGYAGQLRVVLGDYDIASAHGEAALELARAEGQALSVALILEVLGNVALQRGDLQRAQALHTDSAERKRQLKSRRVVSNLLQLGLIACEYREFDRVRQLIVEIEGFGQVGSRPVVMAGALHLRGLVAAGEGDTATAVRLFEQALELRRPAADQQGLVKTLTNLGHVRLDAGQTVAAISDFAEAVHWARASGERVRVIRALEGIARCLATRNADGAVRLAGATDAQRHALGTALWPAERAYLHEWLATVRGRLGDAAYSRAWEDGHASTLAQAVSLAEALTVEPAAGGPTHALSPRELEVAVLLAHGLTNKQIAAELVLSPATIRSHVEHMLMKLDLRSRAQIAVWASQQGLLDARK